MSHRESTHTGPFAPLTPTSEDRRSPPRTERRGLWARVKEIGAVAGLAVTAGTLLGGAAVTMGFRLQGPPQDIAAVRVEYKSGDSAIVVRVIRLEDGAMSMANRLGSLEQKVDFSTYIQCVTLRRTDPAMLPPGCTPIIQSRGGP